VNYKESEHMMDDTYISTLEDSLQSGDRDYIRGKLGEFN
jgi:hypothetical protein